MGLLHTVYIILEIIEKRFQDAELKELFIESGAIVEGSIIRAGVGRKYNRGVWFHKLLYEALFRLAHKSFRERI